MNITWILFKRDLKNYFATPTAYAFIIGFLLLNGLLNYHLWSYLLFLPAVAIYLLSRERQSGTVELLATLPIANWQARSSKLLVAAAVTVISASLTFPVWLLVNYVGKHNAVENHSVVFLPNLLKQTDSVTRIIIQDHDHTLTLQHGPDAWQIVERNNFPIVADKVQELLFGLADMRIVEAKTSNAQWYSQLDVNDISDNNSHALLITVQDEQQQDLVKVIIGKREGIRVNEDYFEHIFVRNATEAQTWLVKGLVPISNDIKDWVDQPLLSLVDSEQIAKMQLTATNGEQIIITKATAEQEDFVLETSKPQVGMVLDVDAVNTLPFEIAELEFNDVIPVATQNIDWTNSVVAELETFAGVTVALTVVQHEGQVLGKVLASAGAAVAPEWHTQVDAFNASKQQWYYRLPPEFYKQISVTNADFLKATPETVTEAPIESVLEIK